MRRLLGPGPNTGPEAVNRTYLEATTARQYTIPGSNNTPVYRRIASLDGVSVDAGAHLSFMFSGLGQYGNKDRGTALVEMGQREANNGLAGTRIWMWGGETNTLGTFYVMTVSAYKYELWYLAPQYTMESRITILSASPGAVLDTVTTSANAPGTIYPVPWKSDSALLVVVYSGGAYPGRPATSLPVRYIGPVQPTTWLPNDEWVNNS